MGKINRNPKKNSRFICLRCLKENKVGGGMYRPNIREDDHVKDLCCLCTKLKYKTENLEVRYCDNFSEKMEVAKRIKPDHYDENGNYVGKRENILVQYRE